MVFSVVERNALLNCIDHHLQRNMALPQHYADLSMTIETLRNIRAQLMFDIKDEKIWIDDQWVDGDDTKVELSKSSMQRYGLSLVAKMLDDYLRTYEGHAFVAMDMQKSKPGMTLAAHS